MWLLKRRRFFYSVVSIMIIIVCTYRIVFFRNHLSELQKTENRRVGFKDIHVVIGYYQGNNLPWITSNLTEQILNSNGYAPSGSAGINGEAVIIPSFESQKMKKLFQINRFNLMASDRIPINRTLPDVRKKECKKLEYDDLSLTTSVIIVFHNEAWSTLMRTIYSVINRSSRHLLKEIILVDDASQREFLKESLDNDVREITFNLGVYVHVVRSLDRVGLIKARLLGAKVAQGKVLTFLDAHCEVTIGWLEPLLSRINEKPNAIVSPVIDIINDDTFQYVRSFELHQGGFNWELHFRWFSLPHDVIQGRQGRPTEPFRTPVMAGGLFSIDKDYFYALGSYDRHMEIWGGENIEISFRGWMCGAELEIVPCSHVGHLFRKSSPYSFPGGVGDVLNSNLARVALVWMDSWKEFYFKLHPESVRYANQSIGSRVKLREDLNCKSFSWYLENIWPTHFLPTDSNFFGKIRNKSSGKCIQSPRTKTFGQPYGLATVTDCIVEMYPSQLFILSAEGYIKTDDSVCLDAPEFKSEDSEVRIMACNTLNRQKWSYNSYFNIVHKISKKCLDLPVKQSSMGLTLRVCDSRSKTQQWNLENVQWK